MDTSIEFYVLDVECVASGKGHNDRIPVLCSLVDCYGTCVLESYIQPSTTIVSYFTTLTGITKDKLINAESFTQVQSKLTTILRSNTKLPILVNSSIGSDIEWMGLKQGVDYKKSVDISEMFKAWNPRYRQMNKFSLQHICKHAINKSTSSLHDPTHDSKLVVELYNKYKNNPKALEKFKFDIIFERSTPGWGKKNNWLYEGVCLAAFYPEKCTCSDKTKKT